MSSFVPDKSPRNKEVPETVASGSGSASASAKRDIVRKKNAGSGGSKGGKKSNKIDDGSTYSDPSALDSNDPNYDSEVSLNEELCKSPCSPVCKNRKKLGENTFPTPLKFSITTLS